jgi:predicted dithiol-disulfide oxidoreductase (DUF899 family)
LWTMWQWLDRAPMGRNEGDMSWFHRRYEYQSAGPEPLTGLQAAVQDE